MNIHDRVFLLAAAALVGAGLPGLASAHLVSSSVHRPNGEPVVGARVELLEPESGPERTARYAFDLPARPIAGAKSDPLGSFRLDAGNRRLVVLRIEAAGFAPFEEELSPADDPGAFVLRPAKSRPGKVLSGGKGLAGARVVLFDRRNSVPMLATSTGPGGSFELPDPKEWAAALVVTHPAQAPKFLFDFETLDVVLEPGQRVAAVAVDPAGEPVRGALVLVDGWPVGRTGEKGELSARTAGRQLLELSALPLVGRFEPGNGTIRLAPGRVLTGRVDGPAGSHPAVRLRAVPEGEGRSPALRPPAFARTDSSGRFRIEGLGAERHHLLVDGPVSPKDPISPIDLTRRREAERTIVVEPHPRLSGRVVDEAGKPVGGANVSAGEPDGPVVYGVPPDAWNLAMSNSEGRFVFGSVGERQAISLSAVRRGYAVGRSSADPSKGGSGKPAEIRIVLPKGIPVAGRVVDETGSPLPGAEIAVIAGRVPERWLRSLFSREEGAIEGLERSGPDGRFTLHLAPGPHQLGFRFAGRIPAFRTDLLVRPELEPLEVPLLVGVSISGKVLGSGKSPAEKSWVALLQRGAPIAGRMADEAGAFLFDGLAPGSYSLQLVDRARGLQDPVEVEAPAGGVVLGRKEGVERRVRVSDAESSRPIPEVSVVAEPAGRSDGWRGSRVGTGLEEEPGIVVVSDLEPGRYLFHASAPGFLPGKGLEVEVAAEETAPAEISISLQRGRNLLGTVRDQSGKPVEGATATLDRESQEEASPLDRPPTATSDDGGELALEGLPGGDVPLVVRKDGFRTLRRRVPESPEGQRVELVLEKGAKLEGVVVDEAGKGIAGATLSASSAATDGEHQETESGENGTFSLEGLGAGRYDLSVRHADFQDKEIEDLDLATAGRLVVRLERGATGVVRGKVRGTAPGALVFIQISSERGRGATGKVDENGLFRIADAPAGTISVEAWAADPGREEGMVTRSKAAELAPGGETEVQIDFDGGLTVDGTVTERGKPVVGASILFHMEGRPERGHGRSDGRGSYRVPGLEPGRWSVDVSSFSSGRSLSRRSSVDLASDRTLDFDLTGGGLSGRVREKGGERGIGGAAVSVERSGDDAGHGSSEARSDASGSFVFSDLEPGEYVVRADHPDWGQVRGRATVEKEGTAEILLELEKQEGIRVFLTDARGGIPLRGTVVARSPSGEVVFDGDARTDGNAVRIPVPPGSYRVSASANGYATATVPATAPSSRLDLPLRPGGKVVVLSSRELRRKAKLVDPAGEEYVRCWCNRIAELEIEGRRTELEHIAAGPWTLVVRQPDGSDSRHPLTVVEGGRVELAID